MLKCTARFGLSHNLTSLHNPTTPVCSYYIQLNNSVDPAERAAGRFGVGLGDGGRLGTAWAPVVALPEYKRLVELVKGYCNHALEAWGLPGHGRPTDEQSLLGWFSVHQNGSTHGARF
jgi:hypothetical protein